MPLFSEETDRCPASGCTCTQFNPPDAWKELQDGFQRFLHPCVSTPNHVCPPVPRRDKCTRCCTAAKQAPFAIVLSCSDSRVPPEILFDQGLGDLFVVRVAGNVATDEAIGSIEYAVAHVKTPKLIVVLGHEKCGAVQAAMSPDPSHDMIPSILNRIYPVTTQGGTLEELVKANASYNAKLLRRYSSVIRESNIPIAGAYYSFSNGEIKTVN